MGIFMKSDYDIKETILKSLHCLWSILFEQAILIFQSLTGLHLNLGLTVALCSKNLYKISEKKKKINYKSNKHSHAKTMFYSYLEEQLSLPKQFLLLPYVTCPFRNTVNGSLNEMQSCTSGPESYNDIFRLSITS